MGKFSITVSDRREDWACENPRLVALQCELDTPGYATQTDDTPGYVTQTTPVDTPGFATQTEPPLTDTPGHGSPLTD